MDLSTVEKTHLISGIDSSRFPPNNSMDSTEFTVLFVHDARRSSSVNMEDNSVKEVDASNGSALSRSQSKYGYLEHIQSYKQFCTPDDKSLPEKVR